MCLTNPGSTVFCQTRLTRRRGVLEHAAGLQIFDQCGNWLITPGAAFGQGVQDIAMMIPSAERNLNEPHTCFAHPSR
jgi:hypothetical protein